MMFTFLVNVEEERVVLLAVMLPRRSSGCQEETARLFLSPPPDSVKMLRHSKQDHGCLSWTLSLLHKSAPGRRHLSACVD